MFLNIIIESNSIESGSHGSIYKASNDDGDNFAVKLIDCKDRSISRLIESSIMLAIKHPYINSAYFVYFVNPNLMIFQKNYYSDVHEYLKTNNIHENIKIKWCNSLILATGFLHDNNIIHGDIKAKNVLVDNINLEIKLSDFSLSLITIDNQEYKHKVSTFTHVPIECLLSTGWSFPLDIWGLGCTLYEFRYSISLFPFQSTTRNLDWNNKDEISLLHKRHINCIYDWGFQNKEINQEISYLRPNIVEEFPVNEYDQLILSCLKIDKYERITCPDIIRNFKLKKPKSSVINRKPLRNKPKNLDLIAGNIYSMLSVNIIKNHKGLMKTLEKISYKLQSIKTTFDAEDIELEQIICEDLHFMLLNLSKY